MKNIILLMNTLKMIPAPLIIQITHVDEGEKFAFIFYNNTDCIKIGTYQYYDIIPESFSPILIQFDIKISDLHHHLNLIKVQLANLTINELEFLHNYMIAKDISNKYYKLALYSSSEEGRQINDTIPSFYQGQDVPWMKFDIGIDQETK